MTLSTALSISLSAYLFLCQPQRAASGAYECIIFFFQLMTLRFVVPRASVCVCVCHCHCLCLCVCLCLSVSLRVCVAIFSIYILNINYVNSSAPIFIIHNGPCAKVISTSVERIAICIHEHLLGSPAECCWPAIKQERVYNTHKEVGQGNLASDWPFWKAQFKKYIYISTRSLPVCRQTSKIPYTSAREKLLIY